MGLFLFFLYGLLFADSCSNGLGACWQVFTLVLGLLGTVSLYLLRPWLKVREKILTLAVDLKLLDKMPKAKDLSLSETAESVVFTLSQLQDNIRSATDTMLDLQQSQTDLLESLPEPVMVLDADLYILRTNDSARTLFGETVVSKNLTAILRDPELLEACHNSLRKNDEESIEFKLSTPVEQVFQARIKPLPHRGFTVLNEHNKSALLLTLNDITAIVRSEQMRADFVANVSHEMRTPLASLIGFIETLLGPARNDMAAKENFLRIMEQQAKNMSRLVEDLLSLSRIEMREHTQPDDPVEVEALLNNIAVALQLQLKEKSMRLIIDCAEDLPPVRGTDDELMQVLANLVTNAIRYGRGGTPITLRARLAAENPPQFPHPEARAIAISVIDQGIGIAAHHIPRLTERFYRVDKARSREVGGTGLGLAIVKHIINRHRGALVIESTENVGSNFTVYIPAYEPEEFFAGT